MLIDESGDWFQPSPDFLSIVFPDDVQRDADENEAADPEQTNRTLAAELVPHGVGKVRAVPDYQKYQKTEPDVVTVVLPERADPRLDFNDLPNEAVRIRIDINHVVVVILIAFCAAFFFRL